MPAVGKLGRKVSDEFTVPLCRGHHREVHRSGDEAAWWEKAGIDPSASARALCHPLPQNPSNDVVQSDTLQQRARKSQAPQLTPAASVARS